MIVSLMVAAALAAMSATAATTRHRDNVTITWMMFETSNLPLSYWQDIVNRFEAKNPGITVTLLPSPTTDRDAYAKQLLASSPSARPRHSTCDRRRRSARSRREPATTCAPWFPSWGGLIYFLLFPILHGSRMVPRRHRAALQASQA